MINFRLIFFLPVLLPILVWPRPAEAWNIEAGQVSLPAVSSGSTTFQIINFARTYNSTPLVFILPANENPEPASLRIRNVTTTSFEIAQVEPPNENGAQPAAVVHFMSVEPGTHILPDGTVIEAGTVSTSRVQFGGGVSGSESWETVNFSAGFGSTPIVLAQIQSMTNETGTPPGNVSIPWLVTSVQSVSTSNCQLALERCEVNNGTISSPETVAYLAVEGGIQGSFTDSGGSTVNYETILSSVNIRGWDNGCFTVNFAGTYSVSPLAIAGQNTHNGGDGGWLRRCSLTTTALGLTVDEDQDQNSERSHTSEQAGIFLFSQTFDADFPPPPIAGYYLDECSYSGAAGEVKDAFGSNNGAISGGADSAADGLVCRTGSSDGSIGSFIDFGNNVDLQLSTGTVSAWIKTADAGSSYRGIVVKQLAYGIFLLDNKLVIYDWSSGTARSTGINLANNSWRHVAFAFDSGVANGTVIYIDGSPALTTTMTVSSQSEALVLGAGNDAGSIQNFNGLIDEVLLFDQALTDDNISDIYANQTAGNNYDSTTRICSVCAVLRANYHFDECAWSGSAEEVKDDGSNGFHGTANNMDVSSTAKFCRSGDFTADSIVDYISLDNQAANGLTDFTVSVWLKTANAGYQSILSGANSSRANEMLMWVSSTMFSPYLRESSGNISIANIADNNWHHMVWTRNRTQHCAYVDNNFQGCTTINRSQALTIDPGGLVLGQEQDSVGGNFDMNQDFQGFLDELKIYDSALSSDDVNALYNENPALCPVCIAPEAEWYFDECIWDGISGEVVDEQGVYNGARVGDALTITSGHICRTGSFDGSGDYVNFGNAMNNVFGSANNVFTVTAWLYPTTLSSGTTNHQTANTFFAKASDSYNDNLEIGVNLNGTLHLYIDTINQDTYADFGSAGAVALNNWSFISVVYDNGTVRVTINGTEYTNTSTWSGGSNIDDATGSNLTIGASIHIDNFFTGHIDEVKVYQAALDAAAVTSIKNESRSACTACIIPIGDYYLDECIYDSTPGEVNDSSSSNNHGTAYNVTNDIAGRVCRTGIFNGSSSYIDLGNPEGLQLNDGTVSAWIKTGGAGSNYRGIVVKMNAYGIFLRNNILVIYDSNTGAFRSTGVNLGDNAWHHVAFSFQSGVSNGTIIYIDGAPSLTTTMTVVNQTENLVIGSGNSTGTIRNFNGSIDEVKIFPSVVSADEIANIYNNENGGKNYDGSSRTCVACSCNLGSFTVAADTAALACPQTRAAVQITAMCDDGLTVKTDYFGTVNLSDTPADGTFYDAISGGASITSIIFQQSDNGIKTVYYYFPDENPAVTVTAVDIAPEPDITGFDTIDFNAYGFAIDTIPTQNSCLDSVNYQITALGRQQLDPGCDQIAGFTGNHNLKVYFEYVDPAGNPAGSAVVMEGVTLPSSVPGTGNVPVNFSNGQGNFSFNYPDAGRIRLHFQFDEDPYDGDPHTAMLGTGNSFTVRPDHFFILATQSGGSPDLNTNTSAGTPVQAAGINFETTIQAVCSDNTLTPNYAPTNAELWVERTGPATNASEGILTLKGSAFTTSPAAGPNWTSAVALFTSGEIIDTASRYSEVGLIRVQVRDQNYFGEDLGTHNLDVGRFIPDHFDVAITLDSPELANVCCSTFAYLGEPFTYNNDLATPNITVTALQADGVTVTQNYEGSYWKLGNSLAFNYSDSAAAPVSLSPADGTPAFTSLTDCNGVGVINLTDTFTYSRPAATSPVAPFVAGIDLSIAQGAGGGLTDSDGVCYDSGSGCQAFTQAGMTGVNLRHGRLMIHNNFGPDNEDITNSPFEIQYWDDFNGDGTFEWRQNSDEDAICTLEADINFCVNPAAHTVTLETGSLAEGRGTLTVADTGAPVTQVRVCPIDPDKLSSISNCAGDNEMCGYFTFGIFRGNDRIINWQEISR